TRCRVMFLLWTPDLAPPLEDESECRQFYLSKSLHSSKVGVDSLASEASPLSAIFADNEKPPTMAECCDLIFHIANEMFGGVRMEMKAENLANQKELERFYHEKLAGERKEMEKKVRKTNEKSEKVMEENRTLKRQMILMRNDLRAKGMEIPSYLEDLSEGEEEEEEEDIDDEDSEDD
ncbi:hypothetical protein B9479_008377, partial [Cryptococcus floricola]